MEIELAKSAGFCFGVTRVVNMVYKALGENKKICTLGNIIHNRDMVAELSKRGVRVVQDICEVQDDETVVVRSHGISKKLFDSLPREIVLDGTCPFVSKIHQIVSEEFVDFSTNKVIEPDKIFVVIIGDKEHPEIKGIEGHCVYDFVTVADSLELNEYIKTNLESIKDRKIKVVEQTTFQSEELQNCKNILDNYLNNSYEIFDTICNATKQRQSEAQEMSKIKDLMIVIGGKNSSNTQKLFNVCSQNCKTIFIENAKELDLSEFEAHWNVGVTAGASTPSGIIYEVLDKMRNWDVAQKLSATKKSEIDFDFYTEQPQKDDFVNKNFGSEKDLLEKDLKEDEGNIDFEKAIERYYDGPNLMIGDIVRGRVLKILPREIHIDIGNCYDAYLPISEVSFVLDDVNKAIKVDDVLNFVVIGIDDSEGLIYLSKKKFDKIAAYNKIEHAFENGLSIEGVVTRVLKDGVLASVDGVDVYISRYHLCLDRQNKDDLSDFVGKELTFRIVNFENDSKKNKIRGSVRELKKESFWSQVKEGDKISGTVTKLANFGAFVDLGGEEGLIFISDLSWSKIKHPSEILQVGEVVEVCVKSLDFENKRVALEYKKPEDNPWIVMKNRYENGEVLDATVVSITPFGAFVQLMPGFEGLVHISEISEQFVKSVNDFLAVGDQVRVKIKELDLEKKKIFLTLKSID